MKLLNTLPTSLHRHAAEAFDDGFGGQPGVEAVLLVNSCARGVATPESGLDMAVLVDPALGSGERQGIERRWSESYVAEEVFRRLQESSPYSGVHFDLFDRQFAAEPWDDGGPDGFELEVGNRVAYSAPLWEGSTAYSEIRAQWLPYYGETLRRDRLEMARAACLHDLEFVPFCIGRNLYFQAFDRLYKAFQEFLQTLFIARRTYPLAYNKWIRAQVEGTLSLPDLYSRLPGILEVSQLESDETAGKARLLQRLLEDWTAP